MTRRIAALSANLVLVATLALGLLSCKRDEPTPDPGASGDPSMNRAAVRALVQEEVHRAILEERAGAEAQGQETPPGKPTTEPAAASEPTPVPDVAPPPTPDVRSAPAPEEDVPPAQPDVAEPEAVDSPLSVVDFSTAPDVDRKNRTAVDPRNRFSTADEYVWAYAVIRNDADTEGQLVFVWKRDGVEDHRASMNIGPKARTWRTWARRRITDKSVGSWAVELLDGDGTVLGSYAFEVAR